MSAAELVVASAAGEVDGGGIDGGGRGGGGSGGGGTVAVATVPASYAHVSVHEGFLERGPHAAVSERGGAAGQVLSVTKVAAGCAGQWAALSPVISDGVHVWGFVNEGARGMWYGLVHGAAPVPATYAAGQSSENRSYMVCSESNGWVNARGTTVFGMPAGWREVRDELIVVCTLDVRARTLVVRVGAHAPFVALKNIAAPVRAVVVASNLRARVRLLRANDPALGPALSAASHDVGAPVTEGPARGGARALPPLPALVRGLVPAAAGAWECGACTLVNGPAAGVCDACEAPRPATPRGATTPPALPPRATAAEEDHAAAGSTAAAVTASGGLVSAKADATRAARDALDAALMALPGAVDLGAAIGDVGDALARVRCAPRPPPVSEMKALLVETARTALAHRADEWRGVAPAFGKLLLSLQVPPAK